MSEYFYYKVSDRTIVSGSGIYVLDKDGKEYIDCISGTFNLALGHNHPQIIAAVKEQLDQLTFLPSTCHADPVEKLASALVNVAPTNLNRVHLRNTGGSTANEGAIRIAQHITGKRDVITMFRGHLGQSMAMVDMGGYALRRQPFPNHLSGVVHVPAPYCQKCFYDKNPENCNYPCVSKIADFIKYASSGSVACLVIEPIFGVGGNFVPPKKYFQELKDFCDENKILLIFDEAQTGFGRTGHFFAADYFGVSPNIMTMAKGMTGSGFPLGAIMTEENLTGMESIYHSFTNCGSLASIVAALKTVEIISEPKFLANITVVGAILKQGLRKLMQHYKFINDVRGVGLMLGVEIVGDNRSDNALTIKLIDIMLKHGLITRISEHGSGNVIKFRPPLILTKQEAEMIVERFASACDELQMKNR